MTPKHLSSSFLSRLHVLFAAAGILTGFGGTALASSFTEPPLVIFGKVLQHGQGASYQLYQGELVVTVVSEADPANRIVFRTGLREVGESAEQSYRIEIPQKHLPSPQDLEEHLRVDLAAESFRFESITIDGQPATPLDPSRATFTTAFAQRAVEHRLDLRVALTETDADGDAMPDWWEDRYALNRYSSADAGSDLDGDGLTNLEEFRGGTDPSVANTSPLVRTRRLLFPIGGSAGIALSIVDVDTPPGQISLKITEAPSGFAFHLLGQELAEGSVFTQADLLAGAITAEVGRDFSGGVMQLEVTDLATAESQVIPIAIDAFSPWSGRGQQPVLWLDAARLADGAVMEWADISGNQRDAFQPEPLSRPAAGGGAIDFGGSGYLYVDMKDLELDSFSVFASFDLAEHHAHSQTLLRTARAAFEIAGSGAGGQSRRFVATQPGRTTIGAPVGTGEAAHVSMVSGDGASFMRFDGAGYFPSAVNGDPMPTSFATLGGSQPIADSTAAALFDGSLREIVIIPGALGAAARSRLEDYQRSRWGDAVVWDFRDETAPMTVTAASGGMPNLINGGWVDDHLMGAEGPDILRGGPGDDLLTGGPGADIFVFGPDSGGADRVTDFSRVGGDVIDLSDIFGELDAVPSACVRLRNRIVSSAGATPTVDTVLELNFDGIGSSVDQTITLSGVALGAGDLPALLAEGSLILGGPRYLTSVELAADATSFPALPVPHEIEIRRAGPTDQVPIDVSLVFGGSLSIDADYRVDGLAPSGSERTAAFAAGETSRKFSITPLTPQAAGGTITIDVASDPDLVAGAAGSLTLTLTEPARVQIATRSHAFRENTVAGVVTIVRSGALDEPLTLGLALGGSAEAGVDYAALPDSITIPAGSSATELMLVPQPVGTGSNEFRMIEVGLIPQPESLILTDPGKTDVVIFNEPGDAGGESFAEWKQREFPGDNDPSLGQRDPDGDGITNVWEYIHGTDPRIPNPNGDITPRIRVVDGHLEIELLSLADLTDVQVVLEGTTDLGSWSAGMANDLPAVFVEAADASSGRFRRIHRANAPLDAAGAPPSRAFRFRVFERSTTSP